MPRFKFQTPQGAIIMEFDESATIYQVRMLLSQSLDRKVKSLLIPAAGTDSVNKLSDSQRMKEVDRRSIILTECEKREEIEEEMRPQSSSNPQLSEEGPSTCEATSTQDEERTESAPREESSSPPSSCKKCCGSSNNSSSFLLPFLSSFGTMAPFGGVADSGCPPVLPFNPAMLHPAVLKYCIHFEIEKFKINIEIFAHAATGTDAAALEKTLTLAAGETLDSNGRFLPVIMHLLKKDDAKVLLYDKTKILLMQMKNAASATVQHPGAQRSVVMDTVNGSEGMKSDSPADMANASLDKSRINLTEMAKLSHHLKQHFINLAQLNAAAQIPIVASSVAHKPSFLNPADAPHPPAAAAAAATQPTSPGGALSHNNNNHCTPSSELRRARRRTTISKYSKKVMVEWYLNNGRYLTTEGRQLLSNHLGLTEENVRVFFKNLRRIEKKGEAEGLSLFDMVSFADSAAGGNGYNPYADDTLFDDDPEQDSPPNVKIEGSSA